MHKCIAGISHFIYEATYPLWKPSFKSMNSSIPSNLFVFAHKDDSKNTCTIAIHNIPNRAPKEEATFVVYIEKTLL